MVLAHMKLVAKCAFKACKMARDAFKLALIRRDNRRTRHFSQSSIPVTKPEIVGDKAAIVCLMFEAASSTLQGLCVGGADDQPARII